MFGLRTDLSAFYSLAARDNRLAPLSQRFRGLKPPCFPSVFEGLVNAIACQQLSLTAASVITLKPAIRYQFKTGQRDWPKT
jgi:DNA-3-methyladenine glycosylase II